MNIFAALALIALGIALDAIHNYIRREAERRARKSGYAQGKREMRLYYQGWYPHIPLPEPSVEEPEQVATPKPVKKREIQLDESHEKALRENGGFIAKVPQAK